MKSKFKWILQTDTFVKFDDESTIVNGFEMLLWSILECFQYSLWHHMELVDRLYKHLASQTPGFKISVK